MEVDDQLPFAHSVYVLVVVCLDFPGFYGLVEQIIISQHGQSLHHALQVVRIVKEDSFFRIFGWGFYIFPVDADQFAAGKDILAVYSQELFQGLLFTVREFQKISVRGNSSVQVNSLIVIKTIGEGKLFALLCDEGKVEIIAVK